jgi:hypothetical protein
MIIATFETRSFTFTAAGPNNTQAFRALRKGWLKHCQQTGADTNYLKREDVNFMAIEEGQCYRDREIEPITNSSPASL